MASKSSGSRPRTKDGENEFAAANGVAPKHDKLADLLSKYVPSDAESFARLTKPSLKAQAQALDVAKVCPKHAGKYGMHRTALLLHA